MGEPSNGWIVRSRADFFDASVNPLSDQAKCLFLILEGHARHRSFCFPSNESLARMTGKSERAIQGILEALQSSGWVLRVMLPGRKAKRQGIILLRRSDPSMPAATDADLIDKARSELLEEEGGSRPSTKKTSRSARKILHHNKDEWNYTNGITGVEENANTPAPVDLFADMDPDELRDMMTGIEPYPSDSPLELEASRTTVADPGVERSAAYQEALGLIRARRIRHESDDLIRAAVMEKAHGECLANGLSEALSEAHMQGVCEALDRELAPEDMGGPYLPTA